MQQKLSKFIKKALFDEKNGYYRKKNPIGKNSDFITAPEISQVFGEMIAAYILQIFSSQKNQIALVEMGAGKGTLFFDILLTINKFAKNNNFLAVDFIKKASFHIIEINQVLIEVQKERLKDFKITWHEDFDQFSSKISPKEQVFFISNELFDCFAIDQYVKTDIGWCERLVNEKNGEFSFILANFSQKTNEFVENLLKIENEEEKKFKNVPFGAIFEYSADLEVFLTKLCVFLQKNQGIAINFDYGYIENEFANSLQSVKNHQKNDIFQNIGNSDITSLVNFGYLQKIIKKMQLKSSLISQREFLISLGVEDRRKNLLSQKSQKEQEDINLAIDRLIDKDKMGELFKCLIIF